jgi:predicted nucleotide-binding protein (sugar kinase/HSP70/actin superfamily)
LRETYKEKTILIPMMAPIHFQLLQSILNNSGYRVELLTNQGPDVVEEGLKYVHNDTCYPALLVIGQMLAALKSGKYDLSRTALAISQTGGGCRASNYIFLLRKALKKAGYGDIPVISLNLSGLESDSAFKITLPMLKKMAVCLIYGDALMLLNNQVKPYEKQQGESLRLVQQWVDKIIAQFNQNQGTSMPQMSANLQQIVDSFAQIPVKYTPKVKVGVVGEIYVKYASLGNNNLEDFLAEQDCEVMIPGMMDFVLYSVDNVVERTRLYGGDFIRSKVAAVLRSYLIKMQEIMVKAIKQQPCFTVPSGFMHTKSLVEGVISTGCEMGEGWLLTAEMLECVQQGYPNIICTQPFGCLPNHICGKGMIRKITQLDSRANIIPIDYDPSATKVNQENRIKLMLAVAKENLAKSLSSDRNFPGMTLPEKEFSHSTILSTAALHRSRLT